MINLDDRIFDEVKTDSQMWLLLHIAKRINKDRTCFPTNTTLKLDCGWGENKVQKVKAELKKLGLLEVTKRMVDGRQRANNYTVNTGYIGIYVPMNKIKGISNEGTLNEGGLNEGTLKQGNRSINNKSSINNNTNKSDFKEQSRKALELIALTEKITSTLSDFCTMNEPKLELMKNKALFKGDYRKHLSAFVEHNIENILFRSSPITFFVKKFTQWLRYAKSYNKGKGKKAAKDYTKIMNEYYIPEIREKIRARQPERFKAYEAEFNDVVVRAEIETNLKKLKGVKNKTYTPYLIFDICYGMLADKAGTIPDRRYSKFKQWYNKLSDYKQNQANLREDFKTFINS